MKLKRNRISPFCEFINFSLGAAPRPEACYTTSIYIQLLLLRNELNPRVVH